MIALISQIQFLENINVTKIFDSLTHPTIDGKWLNPKFNEFSSLEYLLKSMEKNNIYKGFAVGMKNVGGYTHQAYIEFLKPYPNLIPIAYCEEVEELGIIKSLGYLGIKIHPRLSNIQPDDDIVFDIIKEANKLGLVVLYCGFLGATNKFVEKIEQEKLIFLHTGGKDIKETFNLLKGKKNVLLDLSYTICKYPELDSFIIELFTKFYDKICVGSDHPEVSHKSLRERFEFFSNNLEEEAKNRIAYENIEEFMGRTLCST